MPLPGDGMHGRFDPATDYTTMQITLKNLSKATAQQVFDQVATHLLAQGKKSANGEKCLYRGPEGTMCAAGCLIADDEYTPNMEGKGWYSFVSNHGVTSEHEELINRLQGLHDAGNPEEWRAGLQCIAGHFNLSRAVLS